ncbi:MAG: antiviral reverse transcriptase Drt2 [Cetobacterium sp.]
MLEKKVWEEKNKPKKNYVHFDKRIGLESFKSYIYNPEKIAKHSFYPFIHNTIVFEKYSKGELKEKRREIKYSSHKDRLIYSFYSFLLNYEYNNILKDYGIENNVVAYRDNLEKCNIDFAKEAFDFIKKTNRCSIIVGDFTNFFDNLDHKHLKNMLCKVLKCDKLPKDWFNIFKNITKYSYCNFKDILKIKKLSENEIDKLNSKPYLFSPKEFREIKKEKLKINTNKDRKGIPQGSSISAVLSNVYMLDYDKKLYDYVNKYGGLYLRYSDDFIIIIPHDKDENSYKDEVISIISKFNSIDLQPDKTETFEFENNTFKDGKILDYLGFSFDGSQVSLREKTLSKYYYRMYRKAKNIVKLRGNGRKVGCKKLYEVYSIKGAKLKKGNFITYLVRVNKKFDYSEPKLKKILDTHLKKIKKKIKNSFLI